MQKLSEGRGGIDNNDQRGEGFGVHSDRSMLIGL